MTYSKDSLKKLSGSDKVRTTYKVPTLKFNGNTGVFTKFPVGDFKNGEDVTDVELVILRMRRTFTSFEKIDANNTIRMFTNEHNSYNDPVTVFEAKTGAKIKAVGSGSIEDLRNEFPQLRINSNLYCLYDGEVYKLVVRGKSRQSLVDKQKELAKDETEFFEKKLKLVPKQESGTGGNVYYFLNYEVVGDSKLDEVGPHMETIAKVMDIMDEEYAETNQRITSEAKALTGEEDDGDEEEIIPIDQASSGTASTDDKIKVEDIPF